MKTTYSLPSRAKKLEEFHELQLRILHPNAWNDDSHNFSTSTDNFSSPNLKGVPVHDLFKDADRIFADGEKCYDDLTDTLIYVTRNLNVAAIAPIGRELFHRYGRGSIQVKFISTLDLVQFPSKKKFELCYLPLSPFQMADSYKPRSHVVVTVSCNTRAKHYVHLSSILCYSISDTRMNNTSDLVYVVSSHNDICFCAWCGNGDAEVYNQIGGELKECSRCKTAMYCNELCQRKHWKTGHKLYCGKARHLRRVGKRMARNAEERDHEFEPEFEVGSDTTNSKVWFDPY